MKKNLIFMMFCCLFSTFIVSCSQHEQDKTIDVSELKGTLSKDNSGLSNYFNTNDFRQMVSSHKLELCNINLDGVVKLSYGEYYTDSYIIPVIGPTSPKGSIIVCTNYENSKYYAVYMDLSEVQNRGEKAQATVSFGDGTKIADYSVQHKGDKFGFKLSKVYFDENAKVETRKDGRPPKGNETWSECYYRVFKQAKDACDRDPRCYTWCTAVDLVNGSCTASMLAAAAAACLMR